ncbi:DUF3488 domain-containing protein [Streptomyces griseus]
MVQEQKTEVVSLTVRVEVILVGPAEHRINARAYFERLSWEILKAEEEPYPTVHIPGGALPDEVDRTSTYLLAIPVDNRPGRRPEREATQKTKDLADKAHLDMRPVEAKMQRRQRRQDPHWFVCAPRSEDQNRLLRWKFNLERCVGVHDTGRMLFGSYDEVQARIGSDSVRPPFRRGLQAHNESPRLRVTDAHNLMLKLVTVIWSAALLGIPAASGNWWMAIPALAAWALLIWWCAAIMLPAVRRRWHAWPVGLLVGMSLFAITAWSASSSGVLTAIALHLLLSGALFVTGGIRRLVRAGSRKPFLVAAAIAVLPVALPALVGLSPALFTIYGATFHVRAEDMNVANAWQFVASMYVLAVSIGLALLFLSCWGYLEPLFRDRTLRLALPLAYLTGSMALVLAFMVTVLDGASAKGAEAVEQWRSGKVPGHYYGANPQPVCVTPIGPLDRLPVDGQRLAPQRVYGTFGVVDGQVTLWDPQSGDSFPVPADAVQVLTAGKGTPGSSIPRDCRS